MRMLLHPVLHLAGCVFPLSANRWYIRFQFCFCFCLTPSHQNLTHISTLGRNQVSPVTLDGSLIYPFGLGCGGGGFVRPFSALQICFRKNPFLHTSSGEQFGLAECFVRVKTTEFHSRGPFRLTAWTIHHSFAPVSARILPVPSME